MTITNHGTFFIEHHYDAAPHCVFAAWSDAETKRAWFVEGDVSSYQLDFREGGRETRRSRFAKGQEVFGEETFFSNHTVYDEIVPDERIIFTYSMSRNDMRLSVSLATVEFKPNGQGTRLLFTEHAAFFERADGAKMREQGWTELLDRLGEHLNA